MLGQRLRQLLVDRLVGHGKDVAGDIDVGKGRTPQPHQPLDQRLRRIVGRAREWTEAGDENTKPAHRSISAICSAATAGVIRPSATSASVFFTFARIAASERS